jgi:hypothetical protein
MNDEKIELRSPKVRKIIGQIPPFLVRTGISVVFILVLLLLIASKYFTIPYSLKVQVKIVPKDTCNFVYLFVPANKFGLVKNGQKLTIYLDKTSDEDITTNLNLIQKPKLIIENNSSIMRLTMLMSKSLYTADSIPVVIKTPQIFNAEIFIGNISFFDKVFGFKK